MLITAIYSCCTVKKVVACSVFCMEYFADALRKHKFLRDFGTHTEMIDLEGSGLFFKLVSCGSILYRIWLFCWGEINSR